MKHWLITLKTPIASIKEYYGALSETDPTEEEDFISAEMEIIEESWQDYNYLLHLEDEEYSSEEEEEEAWEEAYQNWIEECYCVAHESSDEEFNEYDVSIIYEKV